VPVRFPGQIADPDLSPDPLGLVGGLDPYAHVDDPRTSTDVLGLAADRPSSVHARLAAELIEDFPVHDLPPALALTLARSFDTSERAHALLTTYQTPAPKPCD
jgi:hypothetical protein